MSAVHVLEQSGTSVTVVLQLLLAVFLCGFQCQVPSNHFWFVSSGGSLRAIDGDFLAQLVQLPDREVQLILGSVTEGDLPKIHAGDLTLTGPLLAQATSPAYVLDLLDRVLSIHVLPEQ